MTSASVKNYVRSIPYFQAVAEDELAYITENSLLRTYDTGEIIFMEGEPAQGLWIVERGAAKIFKLNQDGGEHILHLRGQFHFLL